MAHFTADNVVLADLPLRTDLDAASAGMSRGAEISPSSAGACEIEQ